MNFGEGLNQSAFQVLSDAVAHRQELGIQAIQLECGAHVVDFGIGCPGGLQAGIRMAQVCLAGKAQVNVTSGERDVWPGAWVQVATDQPAQACMLGQYAGWPVKVEKFFAMGSGPMRLKRGKEELLVSLSAGDPQDLAVGTLECDQLPGCDVARHMASECGVEPDKLWVAVAPTRSIAGCVQVVARSVETSLHKLHELGFPLGAVRSAYGIAPLAPPTPDFATGIGRTNDAILYGGHVGLWVDADDEQIAEVGGKLPSSASRDFGEPFSSIFARYDYDFYKIDPGLFSPAEVLLMNVRSGRTWKFGQLRGDLISRSFALESNPVDEVA